MCLYLLLYNFYYCSCNLNNIRNTGLELKHRGYSKKTKILLHIQEKNGNFDVEKMNEDQYNQLRLLNNLHKVANNLEPDSDNELSVSSSIATIPNPKEEKEEKEEEKKEEKKPSKLKMLLDSIGKDDKKEKKKTKKGKKVKKEKEGNNDKNKEDKKEE